ncbi:MAG TPA: glutamate-1-semialdehyde 2,1-aminomutase [Planctomycetia bacterium]|nr:glutamate-1-semialdehyde 2,1-aminomutase [Planctomycetia bacterium]
MPGGVNSPARAFGAVGGHPLFMERGEGPFLFDIDGNRYLDYIGSWGPLILGHSRPEVVEEVRQALAGGCSFGAPTRRESELAELVISAVPSIEMVRMTSSGTEATMSAIRVARGFTRRDVIIKFAGCYHGHADALLVKAGSAATTLGTPSSLGVPVGATQDTLVLPFNDLDQVAGAFAQRGDSIAAVLLEPVVGNMGLVPPAPGFLAGLREITAMHGSLLIFDEVMTGFRLAWGGAQELYGVTPDLTALGKTIGGGMPVGAYGGRKDVMSVVSPLGGVYQAGTLSGNPVAMAAGLATLRLLAKEKPYARLEALGKRLAEGLASAANSAGIPACVQRVGSMLTLFFNPGPVRNYDDATRSDTKAFAKFFWNLLERGVYFPCSQYEALFLSTAHTEGQIDETIAAAVESMEKLKAG